MATKNYQKNNNNNNIVMKQQKENILTYGEIHSELIKLFKKNDLLKEWVYVEDILSNYGDDSHFDIDEFEEKLYDYILENVEFIYYKDAMEFLMKYDLSLEESMELACNMGYDCKKIHSTLLATLLLQEMVREEVGGILETIRMEWL